MKPNITLTKQAAVDRVEVTKIEQLLPKIGAGLLKPPTAFPRWRPSSAPTP